MLLDEFQRIIEIAPDMGIEGGIRSAAQETQMLSFIFSGSSRHLIESIFQDSGRPLYKLCKKIKLDRIEEQHYRQHLGQAAKIMWGVDIEDDVFVTIMQLSERHPYYVNYLCDALWSLYELPPSVTDVDETWLQVVEEERSDLLREYFSMAEGQKKLMIYLASHQGSNLYAAKNAEKIEMPTTSIPRVLRGLLEKRHHRRVSKRALSFNQSSLPIHSSAIDN